MAFVDPHERLSSPDECSYVAIFDLENDAFITPSRLCVDLDCEDEIPPFLYSLTQFISEFKQLFLHLGTREKPYAMIYGDILRKLAKVCSDDYLN